MNEAIAADRQPAPPADMGVTANAVLLLATIAGALDRHGLYSATEAKPNGGVLIAEHVVNGNTYRVSVVQLTGTE